MSALARPLQSATRPTAAPDRDAVSRDLLAQARTTTERKASTFSLACRLLPREIRDDVYLLYLVLRTLDDLVDERSSQAEARVSAAAAWAAGDRAEPTPEVRILERLAQIHPVPRDAMRDFCLGMRQDLVRDRFATEADVDRYCYRVAGTVGVLMTALLGADDLAAARPAAAALGMAMQRTNILRDIDEDRCAGRAFLAQEAIARHGEPLPGCRGPLLREQIARADALYEQGLAGLHHLRNGRRAIAAAAAMYREILREIERRGYGDVAGRAVVARQRKIRIAAMAVLGV